MKTTFTKLLVWCGFILILSTLQAQDGTYNHDEVDRVPVFKGCEDKINSSNKILARCFESKIMAYLFENFQYPKVALEEEISGRIYVKFLIMEDSSINGVEVVRGAAHNRFFLNNKKRELALLIDKEAVRVVKNFPIVQPAKIDGKSVPMSFMLPINIKLN